MLERFVVGRGRSMRCGGVGYVEERRKTTVRI